MPVCGLFHVRKALEIQDNFTCGDAHAASEMGQGRRVGDDCRRSAFPSIAGISLRCRELAVWAKSGSQSAIVFKPGI
jgi:hypothetical protein